MQYMRELCINDQFQGEQAWCNTGFLTFPPGTPSEISTKTSACASRLLNGSPTDAVDRESFANDSQWAFFWCLTHASRIAALSARLPHNEDGVSGHFLEALSHHAEFANSLIEADQNIDIAYAPIYKTIKQQDTTNSNDTGFAKEADVGADILLVVGGENLVSNGLFNIFWIQAKKCKPGQSEFTLHYDESNNTGLQIEAISKIRNEIIGAFSLYIQYSEKLTYTAVADVKDLPFKTGETPPAADLRKIGVRLPEWIASRLVAPKAHGSFETIEDVTTYLDGATSNKRIFIVSATSGKAPELENAMTKLVSHYRRAIDHGNNNGSQQNNPDNEETPGSSFRF